MHILFWGSFSNSINGNEGWGGNGFSTMASNGKQQQLPQQ